MLFAHHADYAAANRDEALPAERLKALRRATHYLLDARLLQVWAEMLEAVGDDRRARFAAARLEEFHNDQNDDFFGKCEDDEDADAVNGIKPAPGSVAGAASGARSDAGAESAVQAALPFQCQPSDEALDYRDFR